jgi:hypothetical protein
MKFITGALVAVGLCLAGCSGNKSSESTSADSVAVVPADSTINTEENGSTAVENEPKLDSVSNAIALAINEISDRLEGQEYQTIHTQFLDYEGQSESTWYFDASSKLKYCDGKWDGEGASGTYTHYFDGDDIVASSIEDEEQESSETTMIHIGFKPVYGYRTTTGLEAGDDLRHLDESGYNSINNSVKDQYSRLLGLIRTHLDSAVVNDQEVSIHIEIVVQHGVDFTQKEDYTISKALFDKLIGK